jgi:hypothetical protein
MSYNPNSSTGYNNIPTMPLPLGQAVEELPGQYLKVLTHPSVRTFVEEKGKASWSIIWVQLIGLSIVSAVLIAINYLIYPPHLTSGAGSGLSTASLQLITILIGVIFTLVLTPVSFLGAGGIIYLIAKVFGGKGTYLAQIYTTLLFGVPLVIVSYLLLLIPVAGSWLSFVPHIYSAVLLILSLIAVHRRADV